MDLTDDDLIDLTDDDLDALRVQILVEQEKRAVIASAPQQAEALNARYVEAIGREDGDPWEQPAGAHAVYGLAAIAAVDDAYYRSTHPANSWRPGDVGAPWERVWPDGDGGWQVEPLDGPAAWQPGLTVTVGQILTHDGALWRAKIAHTTHEGWEPSDDAHAVWERTS